MLNVNNWTVNLNFTYVLYVIVSNIYEYVVVCDS